MGSYGEGLLVSITLNASDSLLRRIVRSNLNPILALSILSALCGCVSGKVDPVGPLVDYQQQRAAKGPQARVDTEGTNDELPLG
ncbi:MAG: hypothetical protein IIB38_09785, partial [Candidatus Hydrogenedentes bacterium]|nr:hypothetical protein [Candidatus Hydrogenedentota bacterium]